MTTKVQVRIRYCFCCSLTVSAILIALYTILFYALLIGLAGWAHSDVEGSDQYYEDCYKQANDSLSCRDKFKGTSGQVTFVVCDSSSYHCSLGLYTAELKYDRSPRIPLLVLNIIMYVILVICALLILLALALSYEWLLLPWVGMMCLDILRGLLSCLFIFILSLGDLSRIAVGIFFLGIQVFHMSLIIIIIAKFQEIRARKKPIAVKQQEAVILADGSQIYPTMPGAYDGGAGARDGYYQPSQYNTYTGRDRPDAARQNENPYGTMRSGSAYGPRY